MHRINDEDRAYLRKHYHNTPNEELARHLGVSVRTIETHRTILGLRKNREFLRQVHSDTARKYGYVRQLNTPEAITKRAKTFHETIERERIRAKWGLEQVTKRRIRTEPRARQLQRNKLRNRGYIIDEQNLIAYYTEDTQRAKILERLSRGETKGRIKSYYDFKPYDGQLD